MAISRNRFAPVFRTWAVPLVVALFFVVSALPALAATLHAGDKVDVTVFFHPELSTTAIVQADGTLELPVAGTVFANGCDTTQLAARIEASLARYVESPAVRVTLETQSDTVLVAGGPGGVLHYRPGETLVAILDELQFTPGERPARRTGISEDAAVEPNQLSTTPLDLFSGPIDFKHVSVLRDGQELGPFDLIALRSSGSPGITLRPGDTVQLGNKPVVVTVRGEVSQPGTAYLYPDEPLARAIDQAGGTTPLASQTAVSLVRAGRTWTVSLGGVAFANPAQKGDVLVVPHAPRVDVLGTVVKPGEIYLRGNETLVSALYYAGGPDRFANLRAVQVIHDGTKTQYDVQALQKGRDGLNPHLVDGDVVFVPQGSTLDARLIFEAISSLGFLIYR